MKEIGQGNTGQTSEHLSVQTSGQTISPPPAGMAAWLAGDDRLASAVMAFEEGDPDENPWVQGKPKVEQIEVAAYDAGWPGCFQAVRDRIAAALGSAALAIEHVGSTAVPGLAAKPVIDVDVIVADPGKEAAYVPALEALGYVLTIREPSWYGHRMLRQDAPRVNLHVFGPACPEHLRHLLFRDWLRQHPQDRQRYADAKAAAQEGVNTAKAYNERKQAVVRDIYARIFAAQGWRAQP